MQHAGLALPGVPRCWVCGLQKQSPWSEAALGLHRLPWRLHGLLSMTSTAPCGAPSSGTWSAAASHSCRHNLRPGLQQRWASIEERTRTILEASERERHRKAGEAAERHQQQSARYEDLVRPELLLGLAGPAGRRHVKALDRAGCALAGPPPPNA